MRQHNSRALIAYANSSIRLDASLKALNTSVNNFSPVSLTTVGGILDVLKASDKVGDAIMDTTKFVNASSAFSFDDSVTIFQKISYLQPDIYSLLNNLAVSRPKFDEVAVVLSVRKTVLSALTLDRELTKELATAITAKLYSTLQNAGPVIGQQIDDHFQFTISVYDKQQKGLELPAIPSNVKNGMVVNY